jgi:hypothetical protein
VSQPLPDRRTGIAAVIAGALLFVSVAAEILWPVQESDGTVVNRAGFALYLLTWTTGALALVVALAGLRTGGSRASSIGRWASLAGAAMLAGFGLLMLVGAVVTGAPLEFSFVLLAVGLLLLGLGAVPLAVGLRRSGSLGGWWGAVLVAGAGALVTVLAAADPWHDLGLFTFDAVWFALGLRLLATRRAAVPA